MSVFSVVILTAAPAGQSAEAGGAFVKIDGREILYKSVELFLNRDNVKQIQVVFAEDMLDEAKRNSVRTLGFRGSRSWAVDPSGWIRSMRWRRRFRRRRRM